MNEAEVWARAMERFSELVERPAGEQAEGLAGMQEEEPPVHALVAALVEADGRDEATTGPGWEGFAEQLAAHGEDPYLGAMLGRYRAVRLLGQGGMGRVYLGEAQSYTGLVAIKVLPETLSAERRERFELEKNHLARFNHPGIAKLLYADTSVDGTPYIVMEYVQGQPITSVCGGLDVRRRLELFLQVCGAVQAAHEQGVIHRDLKPSNMLVGADGTVKLLDFGIAEQLGRTEEHGANFLSVVYAPPEHAAAAASVRGDIYSLGIVLHEMLTGRLPMATAGRTAEEVRAAVQSGALELPSVASGQTGSAWRDLDHICATAWARAPGERYATVESLANDVRLHLARRPLAGLESKWGYVARRFVERNRGGVLAGVSVALLVVGLVAGYTVRLARARDAALAEARHSARVERFLENTFRGGGGDAGPSKDMKVRELLEAGVKNAGALSGDPATQADEFHTLGTVYEDLGSYDEAEGLLKTAYGERVGVFGADSIEAAKTLTEMARLEDARGRLPEARKLAEQAVGISARRLPEEYPERLRAETALAMVDEDMGENARAIAILQRVIRFEIGREDALADLSEAENDLGVAEENVGDLDAAESANQVSLEIDRKMLGDQHPDIADHLMTLAAIDELRKRYDDAVRHSEEAVRIVRAWFRPGHAEVASALTAYGQALDYAGRSGDALPVLEESLRMQEGIYSAPSKALGQTLDDLGNVEVTLGDQAKAQRYYGRALTMYRTLYPKGSSNTGMVLVNASRVSLKERRYGDAEAMLREALTLESAEFPAEDTRLRGARFYLGKALVGEGRYREAEPLLVGCYEALRAQKVPDAAALEEARAALEELYRARHDEARAAYYHSLGSGGK